MKIVEITFNLAGVLVLLYAYFMKSVENTTPIGMFMLLAGATAFAH